MVDPATFSPVGTSNSFQMYFLTCGNSEKAHKVKYFPFEPLSYVENPLNPTGFVYLPLSLSFKLTD